MNKPAKAVQVDQMYLSLPKFLKVGYVNFTWKSGQNKKYYYHFDRLQSFNEDILQPPTVSVEIRGRVPRKPKGTL